MGEDQNKEIETSKIYKEDVSSINDTLDEKTEILIDLIKNKKVREFKERINKLEFFDAAYLIDKLSDEYQVIAFRMLPKTIATDVFSYLPVDTQKTIIQNITDKEINSIIEDLYIDDAVDLLDELPATVVKQILQNAKPETRNLINQFLNYPEDSAGSIMTAEYISLKSNYSVAKAIKRIRSIGHDKETIYTCYVTDDSRKLEGVVTVKELLLNDDDTIVETIMDKNFVACKTNDDQELVSKLLQKYDLLALPVTDNEGRLVGIITIDDAVDIIQEENEEDFEKMAAMAPSNKPYLDMSVFSLYKNRIVWLLILMVTGMITGAILESFESAISALPLLVAFLPMLNDTGGNSGSQSATICIRALTTGEVTPKQWYKIWWKEFRVSLLVAITLSAFNFLRIFIFYHNVANGWFNYAIVICGTLVMAVIVAKSIGALLPLLAKKLHLDPAVCAAPMITTIVDCCTILIYFGLASLIFHSIIG